VEICPEELVDVPLSPAPELAASMSALVVAAVVSVVVAAVVSAVELPLVARLVALLLVPLDSATAALHSVPMAVDVVSELVSMVDLADLAPVASAAMVASLELELTPLPLEVDLFPETVPLMALEELVSELASEVATPAFKAPSLTGELL
jgi:hypothetical protein